MPLTLSFTVGRSFLTRQNSGGVLVCKGRDPAFRRRVANFRMSALERITPQEAQTRMAQGWRHVDVRTASEWRGGRVPDTINVPFMLRGPEGMQSNPDFLSAMEGKFAKPDPLVVSCLSGKRSDKAADALQRAGYDRLAVMEGGFQAWEKDNGLPVERG